MDVRDHPGTGCSQCKEHRILLQRGVRRPPRASRVGRQAPLARPGSQQGHARHHLRPLDRHSPRQLPLQLGHHRVPGTPRHRDRAGHRLRHYSDAQGVRAAAARRRPSCPGGQRAGAGQLVGAQGHSHGRALAQRVGGRARCQPAQEQRDRIQVCSLQQPRRQDHLVGSRRQPHRDAARAQEGRLRGL